MSQQNGDGFIPDGYTRDFAIKGVPGLFPDVRGTFRPMLGWQISAMFRKQNKCREEDDEGREFILGKTITSHISDWDFGQPLNHETFKHLATRLRERLSSVVMGYEPPMPTAEAGQPQEEWEKELAAYRSGESVELLETKN